MSLNDEFKNEVADIQHKNRVKELLEKQGLNAEDVGRISKVSVSTYQTVTKDEEGNATVHDLEGYKYVIHPAWEGYEPLRQADPVEVNLGWTPTRHDKSKD
jgi:hypothetical protein